MRMSICNLMRVSDIAPCFFFLFQCITHQKKKKKLNKTAFETLPVRLLKDSKVVTLSVVSLGKNVFENERSPVLRNGLLVTFEVSVYFILTPRTGGVKLVFIASHASHLLLPSGSPNVMMKQRVQ